MAEEKKKEIKLTEENLGDIIRQGLNLLLEKHSPTDDQIAYWLSKNWDSNWGDSRCFEAELAFLKKFIKEVSVERKIEYEK